MKSKRILLLLLTAILVSAMAVAQRPGHTRYTPVKTVYDNGQVKDASGTLGILVKFDGNTISIDHGGVSYNRYVYDSRRSDGTLVYYGEGQTYKLYPVTVSPDRKSIGIKLWDYTTIYQIQTTNDVGGMIE